MQPGEDALHLRQHLGAELLVAVGEPDVDPPASRYGTSKARRRTATSASAMRMKALPITRRAWSTAAAPNSWLPEGVEGEHLHLGRGEGCLVVVTYRDADGVPHPPRLVRIEPGPRGGLGEGEALDAADVDVGGQPAEVELVGQRLLRHAALAEPVLDLVDALVARVAVAVLPPRRPGSEIHAASLPLGGAGRRSARRGRVGPRADRVRRLQPDGDHRRPCRGGPAKAGLILGTLILVAAIANLPLAVANVALPDIGKSFDASQTALNLVAVGYSSDWPRRCSGRAVGDRYGRKMLLVIGVSLSLPAALAAAWAPEHRRADRRPHRRRARRRHGLPDDPRPHHALWGPGPGRARSIALWSAIGGAISALGPLISGILLEDHWWGSVFLVTLPLIAIGLPLALKTDPRPHQRDHRAGRQPRWRPLGGPSSAPLIPRHQLRRRPQRRRPGRRPRADRLSASLIGFVIRQRRAANPLYDLKVAARPIFWVAASAGIIVFGSLMGAMFIGQQFLQNVLGYSTIEGAADLPAAVFMVLIAPRSAKLVEAKGARFTLLVGYVFVPAGSSPLLPVGRRCRLLAGRARVLVVGAGVGFAGTPASRSLTSSVPVTRAGMASGTADLQRDLGGAIMQSILGALLTAAMPRP